MKKKLFKDYFFTSRLGILLLILLILPMLIYSVYQVFQRNQDEQIMQDIYNRQLNTILFSVNQYSWNQFQAWESQFFKNLAERDLLNIPDDLQSLTHHLKMQYPSLAGLFIQKNGDPQFYFSHEMQQHSENQNKTVLADILVSKKSKINFFNQNSATGYWRPVIVNWPLIENNSLSLFIFPLNKDERFNKSDLGGLFLNTNEFILTDMQQQLQSLFSENTNLMMGIYSKEPMNAIYKTDDALNPPFDRSETLWLLPNHQLVIKTTGSSLSDLARQRVRLNLMFLFAVNLLIISGIIIFLYNIKQQVKLAQMKTDFVANVSHELRTPLSLIRMYAETLEMGRIKDPKKTKSYYQTIIYESQRLSQLINNILDFSRIESNRKRYQFQRTPIRPIIEEVLDMYNYQFQKCNVDIVIDFVNDVPDLFLDKDAVIQVMINLIDNAIKFSPETKSLQLRIVQTNQEVEVSLQDQGMGIPVAEQKLIFNKFYRASDTLVHDTKGSGLGLALVKHIMDIHKGQVLVESQPGKGSCFKLIFPVPAYPEESDIKK